MDMDDPFWSDEPGMDMDDPFWLADPGMDMDDLFDGGLEAGGTDDELLEGGFADLCAGTAGDADGLSLLVTGA
jgi:hypothetical protein